MLNKAIRWLAAILFYLLLLLGIREGYLYLYPADDGYAEDYKPLTEANADSLFDTDAQRTKPTDYGPEQIDRVYYDLDTLDVEGKPPRGAHGPIEWKDLEDVTYEARWYETLPSPAQMAVFGESVAKLDGKTVEVTGFMIPESHTGVIDALSKFSYAQCFFCTGGSRASVMQVSFKKQHDLELNAFVTLRGTLWLNGSDINKLDYVLTDAEVIKTHQ